ncbi:hypothetical protein Csp2054_14175 [Curtobacterium sp. 'Ferrero']|nr:hypothetical protein Csp2054_14175 [Curtobacterium sp. 'Ferrero']
MKIGSLFSGYGGLDLGVQQVLGGTVAWHVEFDAAPSAILAHHWPNVPNYGDVTAVDWSSPDVERVDVLTGGFPCQDVSLAGLRRGLRDGTRSGLWSEFARAIDALRPSLVVIENVRGLLSATADRQMESSPWGVGDRHDGPALRALGAVLGDLAELGYDAEWCGLRAADAGAPHGRYRVFVVALPADASRFGRPIVEPGGRGAPHPAAPVRAVEDADGAARGERWLAASGEAPRGWTRSDARGRGGAPAADAERRGGERRRGHGVLAGAPCAGESDRRERERDGDAADDRSAAPRQWGPFGPAVERWERVTGRVAPAPTNPDGRGGSHRLAPEFVEWMMGLPAGHVTGAPITRAQQLKALGNGVVPQQAALAVRTLLERTVAAA